MITYGTLGAYETRFIVTTPPPPVGGIFEFVSYIAAILFLADGKFGKYPPKWRHPIGT